MVDGGEESTTQQGTRKYLGVFEAILLLPLLALFIPYGIEYYYLHTCEHIPDFTIWLFSAPIWYVGFPESGITTLYFLSRTEMMLVWYLYPVRICSLLVLILYFTHKLSKVDSLKLIGLLFIAEEILVLIPLSGVYHSIPVYSFPLPFFSILSLVVLALRDPVPKTEASHTDDKPTVSKRIRIVVFAIIIICLLVAPAYRLTWFDVYYTVIHVYTLLLPFLFWEYFIPHQVFRYIFAIQVIRYYQNKTSLIGAIIPGIAGLLFTILLNIPSQVHGFTILMYRPNTVIFPIPILFSIGVVLLILKPVILISTPENGRGFFQRIRFRN